MNQKRLKDIKVGVVGVGMVGGAMANYFKKTGRTPFLYDPHKKLGCE